MTLARRSPLLLAVLTLAIPAAEGLPADKVTAALPGLEKYVEALRDRTGVPGLAIAVVRADKLVYVRGFGVREIGAPGPRVIWGSRAAGFLRLSPRAARCPSYTSGFVVAEALETARSLQARGRDVLILT
jgi:hypothetical protein